MSLYFPPKISEENQFDPQAWVDIKGDTSLDSRSRKYKYLKILILLFFILGTLAYFLFSQFFLISLASILPSEHTQWYVLFHGHTSSRMQESLLKQHKTLSIIANIQKKTEYFGISQQGNAHVYHAYGGAEDRVMQLLHTQYPQLPHILPQNRLFQIQDQDKASFFVASRDGWYFFSESEAAIQNIFASRVSVQASFPWSTRMQQFLLGKQIEGYLHIGKIYQDWIKNVPDPRRVVYESLIPISALKESKITFQAFPKGKNMALEIFSDIPTIALPQKLKVLEWWKASSNDLMTLSYHNLASQIMPLLSEKQVFSEYLQLVFDPQIYVISENIQTFLSKQFQSQFGLKFAIKQDNTLSYTFLFSEKWDDNKQKEFMNIVKEYWQLQYPKVHTYTMEDGTIGKEYRKDTALSLHIQSKQYGKFPCQFISASSQKNILILCFSNHSTLIGNDWESMQHSIKTMTSGSQIFELTPDVLISHTKLQEFLKQYPEWQSSFFDSLLNEYQFSRFRDSGYGSMTAPFSFELIRQ